MSKTVSCRISNSMHEELRERCNLIGESINDFIKAAIDLGLHYSSDFHFGEEFVTEKKEKKPAS